MIDHMKDLPPHVVLRYGSTRRFKQEKRRHAKALQVAGDNLRVGCAFLPNYSRIERVLREIDAIVEELSVKAIGR